MLSEPTVWIVTTRKKDGIYLTVPEPLKKRLDAIVKAGGYRNRQEVLLTALRASLGDLEKAAGVRGP